MNDKDLQDLVKYHIYKLNLYILYTAWLKQDISKIHTLLQYTLIHNQRMSPQVNYYCYHILLPMMNKKFNIKIKRYFSNAAPKYYRLILI